jgi:hypothetical protein
MARTDTSKFLVAVLFATAVYGCAQGEDFKPAQLSSTHSVIYVYRPFSITSSTLDPDITCGHSTIAINVSGYYTFNEEPGTTVCYASSDPSSKIQLETRPETEYFVREVVAPGVSASTVTLTPVDRATGLNDLQSCRLTVR